MMISLLVLLLFNTLHLAKLDCSFTYYNCYCENITKDDFLDEFYRNLPENTTVSQNFSLTIENSDFSNIDDFPKLPIIVKSLKIGRCSLKTIGQNAFEEYSYLEELDLSDNEITNISFVQNLGTSLAKLNLSKNNISYIENVFLKYSNLKDLDLSYNNIDVLDLTSIVNIPNINLFNNSIIKIFPAIQQYSHTMLNLSRNLITSFDEIAFKCSIANMDLSYNNLTTLQISGQKEVYNLSGNKLTSLISYNGNPVFNHLDLSNQTSDINKKWNFLVNYGLKMTNNKMSYLSDDTFNLKSVINNNYYTYNPVVDLTNSSILDIQENYFNNIRLSSLNLSHNNISILRSHVFYQSNILTLNLSFSYMQSLKNEAFYLSAITTLDLSHNEIEIVSNVFDGAHINEIDLSYNKIQTVSSHSFDKTSNLRKISFSYCQIKTIEVEAFVGLPELENIDLSFNRFITLETATFANLPIMSLNLEGNKIVSVRANSFSNLTRMNEIVLFNLGVRTIEENAFFNLQNTTRIDLRNNHISTIPRNLFAQTPRLSEVLLAGNNITHMNPISNSIDIRNLSVTLGGFLEPGALSNINLQYLLIENSEINNLKLNSFDGLYNLLELNFTGSRVHSLELGALNHLYQLKYLDSQNLFRSTRYFEKNSFKHLRALEALNLSALSLDTLDSYCFLGLERLETLLIDRNNLTLLKNYIFFGLKRLKLLDLSSNNIISISDQAFVGLDQLEELILNNNKLRNFEAILPSLKSLHLNHNAISKLSEQTFLSLGELEELNLISNKLAEISVGVFQNLTNLKLLNLSYNSIKQIENGGLSNLENLTKLDISYNKISIFENEGVFFSLRFLTELYLDNNNLYVYLDFKELSRNSPNLTYVGISFNSWSCSTLSSIVDDLNAISISYKPFLPDFDDENINGIRCYHGNHRD